MVRPMRRWVVERPGPLAGRPLRAGAGPAPEPARDEVLVAVRACGVSRADLHLARGDLPARRPRVVPGHGIVGEVVAWGAGVSGFATGDRVGAGWLHRTCGRCAYCTRGAENLCPYARHTGWDADGGYAEYATVPAAYTYRLPPGYAPVRLAPLLSAGVVGFRALRVCDVTPGGRVGLYGFGAAGHLAAQVALAWGLRVHVVTRSDAARRLALRLGAASAGAPADPVPEPLDAAVLLAPAGDLVPAALSALDRGGTLAVAAVHLAALPPLDHHRHLAGERTLRTVTACTRRDVRDLLTLAAEHPFEVVTTPYGLDAADRALADLAAGAVRGAAVLVP